MAIILDSTEIRAGDVLSGTLTGHDDPSEVEIEFVRAESGIKATTRARSAKVVTRAAATTGVFSIRVPGDAAPTVVGRRIRVEWQVRASRGSFRAADQTTVRVLAPSEPELGGLPVSYTPGTRPPMIRALRHELYLSMGMGGAFVAMWLAAAIAINTMESEASAEAKLYLTIGALVVALFPLASLYLAFRTVWPRSIGGFEPTIDPLVASPGSTIIVSSDDPWPDDLRFLCVETYHRTYGPGSSRTSHKRTQFETFEHSETSLASRAGRASFTIPTGAATSFDGEQVQVRWVVRRGGRKIGRWGPIRLSEWAIVVT